ncbi:PAS domain-containing sensor histidine kinase [Hydrogenophaga flava]|uniref:PAS domain-containing sensor histidine kinase n=1 Tax=Hydrogenophaga flava TaxID=65657 RepID=UPI0008265E8A|nr:PAS domain S-box protein [Hydrogenophaga flava]
MSAIHPFPGNKARKTPDEQKASDRERALEAEVQALRAELAQLRRHTPLAGPDNGAHSESSDPYSTILAALNNVFPIGMFRIDAKGKLQQVDPMLQQIFGLPQQEFTDFGWMRCVHPDDLATVQKHWSEDVASAKATSLEFRIIRPGSETITHLVARNMPQFDDQGRLSSQLGFVQDVSQLRKLEAEARIKDELNRQIIASSPDCTKVLDLQGRVLQMTARGCELVEVDDFEQVRGSDWTTWWPEDGRNLARSALDQARSAGSARFVAFGNTFKGSSRWWDTVVSPITDSDGQPVMLLAVSRDISETYEQQHQIRQLNSELETRVQERTSQLAAVNARLRQTLQDAQTLYDKAPCGYHSVDANGIFVLINQTELDWLGYTREEVIGKMTFREHVLQADLPMIKDRLQRLMRGEKLESTELGLRRRDGSTFVALLSSTAVVDEQGRFVRTNNTLVDISARKLAEHALQAQRNFLQTVTNTVPVQLAFYDHDLICRFANASYARWLGSESASLIGLHLRDIARPEDFATAGARLEAAMRGEPQHFEGLRRFPDGHEFYASIEYTPYVENGQVQGLIIQMVDITERKASEDRVQSTNLQLADALQQAQALYNQAPCGYHSLNADGVYESINDTELQWLGYERDEVIGRLSYRDVVLPSRVPLLEDRMARLIREGVLAGAEYEMRRKDGSVFHALLSSAAVRDEQGRFLRSNTTVVDITQRRQAELALRENQRFLQTVTNHVPGVIAYLDAMLRFRFANEEHRRLYGLDPARILGLHISECLPAAIWQEVQPWYQAALDGQVQHYEAWRRTVSGEDLYIRATLLPDIYEGLVQGITVQIIDITERKRIEERVNQLNDELEMRIRERSMELLESEQRFRLMADNLRDYSIYFLDAQGCITDWTDSAQRMEGYSPSEMLGQHYAKLLQPDNPDEASNIAAQMLRMAASRGQHELHTWQTRKDGSRYWAHSILIALRDDSGELRGFSKISRDMTDAKRLDDLMRNINDELENRVVERTEQLLAANKDLESFSYSVSHDLRSPLRHISSFVSLLEEHLADKGDDTTQRYLGTIGNSARHMSQLIDGLLAFSRLGRSAVNVMPVDFTMLVEAVVSQIAHDTEGRVVDWVVAPDLPVVQGDALLLREVWANLLGNAFKYTRPRERARIEVGWSVDPAVGYTFYVKDNGVGFDTKYAQKLFGVFQRLHRASEFEGTGIGLALTRRILERHGGSIWAESQQGEGSTFHFSLPFEGCSPSDSSHDSIPSVLEP